METRGKTDFNRAIKNVSSRINYTGPFCPRQSVLPHSHPPLLVATVLLVPLVLHGVLRRPFLGSMRKAARVRDRPPAVGQVTVN